MNDVVYIKIDENVQVKKRKILIEDIAKVYCSKKDVLNKVKSLLVLQIDSKQDKKYIFSIMKIMEIIGEAMSQVEIVNLGEEDFIVSYDCGKKEPKWLELSKILFVCLTTFFGSAFAIMTFNNDVDTAGVFDMLYKLVTGDIPMGPTILELSYSIGLTGGIIVFYNHFSKKKLSEDPTPIEIEMRLYEDDLNEAFIKEANRGGKTIDVN